MKLNSLLLLFFISFFFFSSSATAQSTDTSEYPYWIGMMQDPEANFFETQKAFEKFWLNRTVQKGDGYKIFKRWEYFMSQRVDEFGNKPKADHVLREYIRYFQPNSKAGIQPAKHWEIVGPVQKPATGGTGQPNGMGRVNAITFHPVDADIIYVGSPAGGLWRTLNHGQTWTPLTDTLPTLGISAIVVDYTDDDVIYIGTGDRDSDDAPGLGVWKSTDNGKTWFPSNTGMGNRVVGRMIMNPLNPDVLMAATSGGIFKSIDKGQSWLRVSSNVVHYKDITYKPGDTTIAYATCVGDFYRSANGGDSWTKISSGIPGSDRMVIGVTPANPNYVYAVLTNQRTFKGLYLSTNSGVSFTMMSNSPNIMDYSTDGSGTSGQAYYDLCVAVDRSNAAVLYVGGVNIFKSTNSGVTWTINAHWTGSGNAPEVHADEHDLVINPLNNRIYSGNDGGLYYTNNGGNSWIDISSGLAISQIYKMGQSAQSRNLVINGYQDNGTAIYDGNWRTELGADGMDCLIDPSDSNYMYAEYYYGSIRRSSDYGRNFSSIYSSVTETGNWVTPYILGSGNSNTMFAGYRNLWRSTNVKATSVVFFNISNLPTTSYIRVVENSSADKNVLYFSREDNKLFRSDNINASSPTFTDLSSGLPTTTWPKDIETHPADSNVVYIVQSNKVFVSNNKGASWTNITGSLPNVSMNTIVFDASSAGDLYVGSDLGVFFKGSWMTDWIPYSGGLPYTVEVTELEIYYDQNPAKSRIKAATYGRGLWSSALYVRPEAAFGVKEKQVCLNQQVHFADSSTGFYNHILWTFQGGNPATSTLSNPVVTYNQVGIYKVTLKIWNDEESDELIKTSYITVDSNIDITVNPASASIYIGDSIRLIASGGVTYSWSPVTDLNTFIGPEVIAFPTVTTTYTVTGNNPFCIFPAGQSQSKITVTPLNIGEVNFDHGLVNLYPNPADSYVELSFNGVNPGSKTITILDESGRKVFSEVIEVNSDNYRKKIDVSNLSYGYHLMNIHSGDESLIIRLMIHHSF